MEASGWCRPQLRPRRPPPEKLDMLDRFLGPWGWGKERGCPCRFVRGRRMFSKNRRELQWRRRREGRTLLGGGRGILQYLHGSFFCLLFPKDRPGPRRIPPSPAVSSSPPCRVTPSRLWAGFFCPGLPWCLGVVLQEFERV